MTEEDLTGILLRVLGALPNGDDMKIARAIDREATARERSRLAPLFDAFDGAAKYVGCGDNSCMFVKPSGMATNGGCRCCGRGGHKPFVPAALAKLFREVACLRSETAAGGGGET